MILMGYVSFREGKQQEFHASWFQTISGSERFRNPTVSELYRPCESRTHLAVAIPVPAMYGIFIYTYYRYQSNVAKYTMDGVGSTSSFPKNRDLIISLTQQDFLRCRRKLGIGNVSVRVVMRPDRVRESKYFLEATRMT